MYTYVTWSTTPMASPTIRVPVHSNMPRVVVLAASEVEALVAGASSIRRFFCRCLFCGGGFASSVWVSLPHRTRTAPPPSSGKPCAHRSEGPPGMPLSRHGRSGGKYATAVLSTHTKPNQGDDNQ